MPALALSVDSAMAALSLPAAELLSGVPLSTNAVASAAVNTRWSPDHSNGLYNVDGWGAPYFSVNSSGNVTFKIHQRVRPPAAAHRPVPGRSERPTRMPSNGVYLPVKSQCYNSPYQGVYPVKCNKDCFVVEDIVKFGSKFRFGLEAGSKPELILAMSSLCKVKDAILQLRPVLSEKKLLVSVVAGVKLKDLQEWAGHDRFIRVMPSTPSAVGEGALVYKEKRH